MLPVGLLMIEHRLIERMIRLMKEELDRIGRYGRVDQDFIDDAVDFMRSYSDICHHGKEENILFQKLNDKHLSGELKKILDELVQEHIFARKTVDNLEWAKERYVRGERDAPADIIASLNIITEFYPQHIMKEEKHFFLQSMDYLSEEEKDQMLREFSEHDSKIIHERYRMIVGALEGQLMTV
jgi:hemerythrin-like domain-containing protein